MLNEEEFIQELHIEDKTDDELKSLIDLLELKISSYIGIPLNKTEYTYIERDFNGEVVIVDQYPLIDLLELTIDNDKIQFNDLTIDNGAGIIYLEKKEKGFLKVKYNYGLTEQQYETYVEPLLKDMVNYELDHGWTKNASSIKEGEITVSYDTSIGTGAIIQSRLEQLKQMFGVRVAMI